MASDPDLDDLVAPLREDNVSGASALSRTAADVLRRAAVRLQAGSIDELRRGLGRVSEKILEAQPSMAPMVTLVRTALDAVEAEESLEDGRLAAANAAEAFRDGLDERTEAVVRAATEILPAGGTVGTISRSGTVRRLLESEAGPRGIRVVCFESRPMNEGRGLAEALAEAGVDVTFAVDAAVDTLARECDIVVFGTDGVGDDGVVNKIGSAALARAAVQAGMPVHVLADDTKLLPRGYPIIVDDERPVAEVWDDAPAGVSVWNRYFEVVSAELVTGIVTEGGVRSPAEVEEIRGGLALPAGLRTWATGRSRG